MKDLKNHGSFLGVVHCGSRRPARKHQRQSEKSRVRFAMISAHKKSYRYCNKEEALICFDKEPVLLGSKGQG